MTTIIAKQIHRPKIDIQAHWVLDLLLSEIACLIAPTRPKTKHIDGIKKNNPILIIASNSIIISPIFYFKYITWGRVNQIIR